MADVFLINSGEYSDFLQQLETPADNESFFFSYKKSNASSFLSLFFNQINRPITVVLEEYYIDEDYLDLYSHYYVFSYQENTKYAKRVSVVDCSFDDKEQFYDYWYSEMENELSKKVLAIFVIPESSSRHISKAYIDPKVLLNKPFSRIILSDVQTDILGRRIHMNAFPFRQTDSELLSCSEVSMQGVFDYYYNKNQGFNKERLSSLLKIKQELSKIHGFYHENGMDIQDICSVFRQKGYETVYYSKNAMQIGLTSNTKTKMLVSMFYPYVTSGYPCLLLVKPKPESEYVGHCINSIGTVENYTLSMDNITAERIKSFGRKTYNAICGSEFCTAIITVDDQSCLNYIQLFSNQKPNENEYEIIGTVIVVSPSVKMSAYDAYSLAKFFLRLDSYSDLFEAENEESIVISIFLAKSTEYVRYRINNSKVRAEKELYANCPFPDYVWICEYSTSQSYAQKLADAELVLDATIALPNIYNTIVLFRSGNTILLDAAKMMKGYEFGKMIKIFEPSSVYYSN